MSRVLSGFSSDLSIAAIVLCLSCGSGDFGESPEFDFCIVNAGQGLAQIGWVGDTALAWDLGPPEAHEEWARVYESIGRPFIKEIFISHSELDHMGGLQLLDNTVRWSGILGVSVHEDTSLLRQNAGTWGSRIRFRQLQSGDIADFTNDISIECLWPFAEPVTREGDWKNRYSLVFRIRKQYEQILLTSDIDTASMKELCRRFGTGLKSDLLIIPHHGSAGSVDEQAYGMVNPSVAIVSCSYNNSYGHPSPQLLTLLMEMGTELRTTYAEGSIFIRNNGYYISCYDK